MAAVLCLCECSNAVRNMGASSENIFTERNVQQGELLLHSKGFKSGLKLLIIEYTYSEYSHTIFWYVV